MTPQQIIADLARAFPRQKIDRDTYDVYRRELADVPDAVLEAVARDLIRTHEWFPTVRAIREAAAEKTLALPAEAEALAQVEGMASWTRQDAPARSATPPSLHPLVKQALDAVGGSYAFRTATEPAVIRGQFLRLFKDGRARAVAAAQAGDLSAALLPAAPAATALPAGD